MSEAKTVRLLLADDHTLFRQSLCSVLRSEPDFEIVAEAQTAESALHLAIETRPDVVLLDVSLADGDGIVVAGQLRAQLPDVRILMLSMHRNRQIVERALQNGADGYALKEDAIEDLIYAVRSLLRGGRYLSPTLLRQHGVLAPASGRLRGETNRVELTERQRQILLLVAEGLTNREVAERLGIRRKTVENHRMNIAQQVGLTRAVDYVRYAIRRGWMDP